MIIETFQHSVLWRQIHRWPKEGQLDTSHFELNTNVFIQCIIHSHEERYHSYPNL